jgi:hypothetical protein
MVRVSKNKDVRVPVAAGRTDSERVQVVEVKRPTRAVRWHISRATTTNRVSK